MVLPTIPLRGLAALQAAPARSSGDGSEIGRRGEICAPKAVRVLRRTGLLFPVNHTPKKWCPWRDLHSQNLRV